MTNDSNFVGDHTAGVHPFPSRTRKLSPAGPIVLHAKVCGRVGHRRHKIKGHQQKCWWPFPIWLECVAGGRCGGGLRMREPAAKWRSGEVVTSTAEIPQWTYVLVSW